MSFRGLRRWWQRHGSASGSALILAAVVVAVVWGVLLTVSPDPVVDINSTSQPEPTLAEPETRTISALSDSHIYNEGSWFRLTVEAGELEGYAVGTFASQPGADTETIRALVPKTRGADWVIVQGGTNDLLAGDSPQQAAAGAETLARLADQHAGSVIVALVPPSDAQPAGAIETNDLLTRWAKANDVPVLDVYSPVAAEDGTYRAGLSDDGVHANDRGARLQAQAVLPQLRGILG